MSPLQAVPLRALGIPGKSRLFSMELHLESSHAAAIQSCFGRLFVRRIGDEALRSTSASATEKTIPGPGLQPVSAKNSKAKIVLAVCVSYSKMK